MPTSFIDELKNSIQTSIPTDSAIVGKVTRIIYDPSSSANDLAQIIERDPPLTAKILKVANSVYYGASTTINSLRRAVVILGFDTIKEIISAVSVSHFFFTNDRAGEGLDRRGLWVHSVAVAKAARIISTHFGGGRPDVSYTVGLLHDIGKIVLAILFPEHYTRVISFAEKKNAGSFLRSGAFSTPTIPWWGRYSANYGVFPMTLRTPYFPTMTPRKIRPKMSISSVSST